MPPLAIALLPPPIRPVTPGFPVAIRPCASTQAICALTPFTFTFLNPNMNELPADIMTHRLRFFLPTP